MPRSSDPPTPAADTAAARTPTGRARRNTGRTVLSDVAKLAGVSTATVSRVYNEPDKVSANVRERVEQAALTLNWFPNAAGRALASTRSHIAGIIIPTLDDQVFASQVSGMQAAFAARDITLFLGCSNYDPAQALVQVRAMLARGVEAMAVVGEAHPAELFDALRLYRVPYAVTYAYREGSPHDCIGFDNHAAYAEITEHLIGFGHRSFAVCIQPTRDNDRVQARVAGIRTTLERQVSRCGRSTCWKAHRRSRSAARACARSGNCRASALPRSSAATIILRLACCGRRRNWASRFQRSFPSPGSTIWRCRGKPGQR